MAKENFLNRKWDDRSFVEKALYGGIAATGVGGLGLVGANEVSKIWKGDTDRLAEINQQAADLENSEFNTAKLTAENQDYYDQVFLNSAKAQRAAEMGMTDAETAAAKQTYAENRNLGMQNALNAGGGNISKYINANLNANDNKFATSLAAQNDAVKRQNQQVAMQYLGMLGDSAQNSQNVFNQNFQKQILTEQAIGQAKTDWFTQRDTNRRDLVNAGEQGKQQEQQQ